MDKRKKRDNLQSLLNFRLTYSNVARRMAMIQQRNIQKIVKTSPKPAIPKPTPTAPTVKTRHPYPSFHIVKISGGYMIESRPDFYPTKAAAKAEAQRLQQQAIKNRTQTLGVYGRRFNR